MEMIGDGFPTSRRTHGVDDALHMIRRVLRRRADDTAIIADLRLPIDVLCTRARGEQLPPERLLTRMKETLKVIPKRAGGDDEELRTRIVTLMIDTYFSSGERPA